MPECLGSIGNYFWVINPTFLGLGNFTIKLGILKIVGKNCGNFMIFGGKLALIHLVTLMEAKILVEEDLDLH